MIFSNFSRFSRGTNHFARILVLVAGRRKLGFWDLKTFVELGAGMRACQF